MQQQPHMLPLCVNRPQQTSEVARHAARICCSRDVPRSALRGSITCASDLDGSECSGMYGDAANSADCIAKARGSCGTQAHKRHFDAALSN